MEGKNRKRVGIVIFWILGILLILLITIVYLRYADLKKGLVARVSEKLASLIGQGVVIEDLSLSLGGTINLYNVTIRNPEGFPPGNFLHIKRIRLDTELRQFLRGVFHFQSVILTSPELTLLQDEKGRWNIPSVFTRGSEKSVTQFQVDEMRIESGLFSFNEDKSYRADQINLRLKNLSSRPGSRLEIGGIAFYGGNKVQVDGWVSLHDVPQKVNVSIASKDFLLAPLAKYLRPYSINIEKVRTDIDLHAEGDTEKGFHLVSTIRGKGFQLPRFIKSQRDIYLRTDAILHLPEDSLVVNPMTLQVDGVSKMTLKGSMTGLRKRLSFNADIDIDNLDLSQINLMKDVKVVGRLTSKNLRITGEDGARIRKVSGSLNLKEGGIEAAQGVVEKIDGAILFSSDQENRVKGEATARVVKLKDVLLAKPVDIRLTAALSGRQGRMAVISSLALSSFEISLKGRQTINLEGGHISIDGVIQGRAFSGRNSIELKGIQYGGERLSWMKSASLIDYGQTGITARNLTIETEELKSSARRLKVTIPEKENRYEVDVKGLEATYRDRRVGEARLKECDLSLTFHQDKESLKGNLGFSVGSLMIQDIPSNHISGTGTFDGKSFSVDIQRAEVYGSSIKVTASGRTSEGPYPIRINAVAEGLDLGRLSEATSRWIQNPYRVGGSVKRATFEGTINGRDLSQGHAIVESGKISLSTGTGKKMIKGAPFHGEFELAGKDLLLKAEAGVGALAMKISGTAKRFMESDRLFQAKIILPEAKLTDIRESLWDVFPDSLLYVGLEGSVTLEGSIEYGKDQLGFRGNVSVRNGSLQGENGEYSIRSINGTLPIVYRKGEKQGQEVRMPSFERSQFDQLIRYYGQGPKEQSLQKITIQSLVYGFDLLEDIQLFVEQKGPTLNVERFNANIFGGRLTGTAVIDLSDGLRYGTGLLLKGVSLKTLCDRIEPIRGFISGRVDGIATLKGSGPALSGLIGMADFWTYPAKTEKMVISKEFLQKIGGPSVKPYLRSRNFDKGILSVYLKDGAIVFKELEISNKNILGMTDLSVKVAPLSNRIAVEDLLWTIAEAAERAKKK